MQELLLSSWQGAGTNYVAKCGCDFCGYGDLAASNSIKPKFTVRFSSKYYGFQMRGREREKEGESEKVIYALYAFWVSPFESIWGQKVLQRGLLSPGSVKCLKVQFTKLICYLVEHIYLTVTGFVKVYTRKKTLPLPTPNTYTHHILLIVVIFQYLVTLVIIQSKLNNDSPFLGKKNNIQRHLDLDIKNYFYLPNFSFFLSLFF